MNKKFKITALLNDFVEELNINEEDNKELIGGRKLIRKSIRDAFDSGGGNFGEHLLSLRNRGEYSPEDTTFDGKVKFLTQGSYQYKTLNRPNSVPPQQMDLDDGVYFQSSDIESIKGNKNKAKILFSFIEKIVSKLAEQQNWQIDTSKPTCVRIILCKDKHIDLPIYLVPDNVFSNFSSQPNQLKNEYNALGITYYESVLSQVMMAHKEQGWMASDPRKIIEWVLLNKMQFGKNFLKVCRIMKAWRDNQWEKPSLSSICIMAMVADSMKELEELEELENKKIKDMETDELLFKIVWKMKECLKCGVRDPENYDECLDKNISPQEKQNIIKRMTALYSVLEEVLYTDNDVLREKNKKLTDQFGRFFPSDVSLCEKLPLAVAGVATLSSPATANVVPPAPFATTESIQTIPESEIMPIPTEGILWLKENQPGLQVNAENHISGILRFDAEYKLGKLFLFPHSSSNERRINDTYLVDIIFYKNGVPKVWEIGNRILSRAEKQGKIGADVHLNADDSCCLSFPSEVEQTVREYSGIEEAMKRLIIPYFYYQSYCEKFNKEPWEGRKHDYIIALLQSCADNLKKWPTKETTIAIINNFPPQWLLAGKIGANDRCVCSRKIKAKKCDCGAVEGYNLLRKYTRKYC